MTRNANDIQVGGKHYQTAYQHWDFIVDYVDFGPDYFIGCATKYLQRHKRKDGRNDLEKAIHFASKLIELVHQRRVTLQTKVGFDSMIFDEFCEANNLDEEQSTCTRMLLQAFDTNGLLKAVVRMTHYCMAQYPTGPLPDNELFSTKNFIREGYGTDKAYWQCLYCRAHIVTTPDQNPNDLHFCAQPKGYVDQDRVG